MREALKEAKIAFDEGEIPIGAVVVLHDEIIGRGRNSAIRFSDPTAHAEVMAIREAACGIGNYRLLGSILYVTIEPCIMCAGAIISARIKALCYGAPDLRGGGVDSLYKVLGDVRLNHTVEVISGICESESVALLREFFHKRRDEKGEVPKWS